MKRIRSGAIKLIVGSVITVALIGTWFFIYLIKTDAPALHGQVEYHVPYKDDMTLDIYYPTVEDMNGPYPVLMFVHGGAWISGTKGSVNNNRFNEAFNQLREAGYYIVSPDYTLAENGKTPFPDCVQDIFEAVQWVVTNTDRYQMDLENFGILGESAGGHLAMMVTFSDPEDFDLSLSRQQLDFLISVYAPCDLGALYHAPTTDSINALISRLPASLAERLDLSRLLVGFDPESQPARAEQVMRARSPITYMENAQVPVLVIHGVDDQVVPVDQSHILVSKLESLGSRYEAHYFEGVNHAFQDATQAQKDSIQNLIIDFVLKQNQYRQ